MTNKIHTSTKVDKEKIAFEEFLMQNNIEKSADFCHFKKEDDSKGDVLTMEFTTN